MVWCGDARSEEEVNLVIEQVRALCILFTKKMATIGMLSNRIFFQLDS